MGRVLSIDYGEAKCGLALSDESREWAFGRGIVDAKEVISVIKDIHKKEVFDEIILGYPINLKGEKTSQTEKVEVFKSDIEKLGFKVVLVDERMTTQQAKKMVDGEDDEMAAKLLLEGYFNKNKT